MSYAPTDAAAPEKDRTTTVSVTDALVTATYSGVRGPVIVTANGTGSTTHVALGFNRAGGTAGVAMVLPVGAVARFVIPDIVTQLTVHTIPTGGGNAATLYLAGG